MIQSYTGFRTVSRGVIGGVQRPLLNGKFIFPFGPLDQGFWPGRFSRKRTWGADY
jgi:hypothetical protein